MARGKRAHLPRELSADRVARLLPGCTRAESYTIHHCFTPSVYDRPLLLPACAVKGSDAACACRPRGKGETLKCPALMPIEIGAPFARLLVSLLPPFQGFGSMLAYLGLTPQATFCRAFGAGIRLGSSGTPAGVREGWRGLSPGLRPAATFFDPAGVGKALVALPRVFDLRLNL
jgi:hypothetical protein